MPCCRGCRSSSGGGSSRPGPIPLSTCPAGPVVSRGPRAVRPAAGRIPIRQPRLYALTCGGVWWFVSSCCQFYGADPGRGPVDRSRDHRTLRAHRLTWNRWRGSPGERTCSWSLRRALAGRVHPCGGSSTTCLAPPVRLLRTVRVRHPLQVHRVTVPVVTWLIALARQDWRTRPGRAALRATTWTAPLFMLSGLSVALQVWASATYADAPFDGVENRTPATGRCSPAHPGVARSHRAVPGELRLISS